MSRKGLSREYILETAANLVEKNGFMNFSLRDLAKALHVQAPSLYNHYSGIEALNRDLSLYISEKIDLFLANAIKNKTRDDALLALGQAYRRFADIHPEFFRVILFLPGFEDTKIQQAAAQTIHPIVTVLNTYDITQQQRVHLQRMFRSLVHGYMALYQAGYMAHFDTPMKKSYDESLHYFLEIVHNLEKIPVSDFL